MIWRIQNGFRRFLFDFQKYLGHILRTIKELRRYICEGWLDRRNKREAKRQNYKTSAKKDGKLPSSLAPGARLRGVQWAQSQGWTIVRLRPRWSEEDYVAWWRALRNGAVVVDVRSRGDHGREWYCAIPLADTPREVVEEIAREAGMMRRPDGIYDGPTWPWGGLKLR